MITISSQRYLDDEVVAAKALAEDFNVAVSPVFRIDGVDYRVVLDGHHSFAAAVSAGVEPVFIEQDSTDNDTIGLLMRGQVELFLETSWMDSDWYDIRTGRDVW